MEGWCFRLRKTDHNEGAAGVGNINDFDVVGRHRIVRHGRNLRRQFKPDAVGTADENSAITGTAAGQKAGGGQRRNEQTTFHQAMITGRNGM